MSTPLGEMLIQRGLLNADQLRIALREQNQHAQPLGQLVIKLGFLPETPVYEVLAEQFALPFLSSEQLIPHTTSPTLPWETLNSEQILPVGLDLQHRPGPTLKLATSRPNDLLQQDRVRALLPAAWRVQPCLATPQALTQAIAALNPQADAVDCYLGEIESSSTGSLDGHAIIGLVDALIHHAVDLKASDIHFEPAAHCLHIRLRIDGQMQPYRTLQRQTWRAVLVRLKVLGELDISETRLAQDGRLSFDHHGRPIDIRLSTLPTLHGENLVMRLLDRNKGILPLHRLGIPNDQTALLTRLLDRPDGLILLTGPTGSGKTTTLYALLQHLQSDRLHIMTLEDPVEYALPGIQQTLVDPPRLDFAQGVRAMLRQDPDVLLIGEIRDEQTAQMALRATQTGHQVFSTLHATDPFVALQRLQQLKIPLTALRGCLTAIINQRLVRTLCPDCTQASPISDDDRLYWPSADTEPMTTLYQPIGCPNCRDTGFRGRQLLLEILPYCHPALEALLDDQAHFSRSAQEVLAQQAGWRSLRESGLACVRAGLTTLAELKTAVALEGD